MTTLLSKVPTIGVVANLNSINTSLAQSFERLSSGLRINSAKDDPAGLALVTEFSQKSDGLTQAIRNVNDGVSMLNLAEAAAVEVNSLLSQMQELATQASNGTLTTDEREALDTEFQELKDEYERVLQSTEFNDRVLLDGTLGGVTIQAGTGTSSDNQITIQIGDEVVQNLQNTLGDGTFDTTISNDGGAADSEHVATADLNGDGILDAVIGTFAAINDVRIAIGNGDGTFQTPTTLTGVGGIRPTVIDIADLDSDGNMDIVAVSEVDSVMSIFLGNGDGTFAAATSETTTGLNAHDITIGDIDNDNDLDMIVVDENNSTTAILLGDGTGNFTTSTTTLNLASNAELADLDGDGNLDLITGGGLSFNTRVYMGDGSGTFGGSVTTLSSGPGNAIQIGDVDSDGNLDIVASNAPNNYVLLGDGTGGFSTAISYATNGTATDLSLTDIDGDGDLDILGVNGTGNDLTVQLNAGDGTFGTASTFLIGGSATRFATGDFDGDDIVDVLAGTTLNNLVTLIQGTTQSNMAIDTQDRAIAAVKSLDDALDAVALEIGGIGAGLSRFDFTLSYLGNTRDQFDAAVDRVRDIDVAQETADLVRLQVLQQGATAVLAQANLQPQVALSLLSTGGS